MYTWDYRNQFEWMRRVKDGIGPLIISAAITGAGQGKESNPSIPLTLEEQVAEARRCYEAGASIIHIHARDPKNPADVSNDPERFREINAAIREACPEVIINNTSSGDPIADAQKGLLLTYAWAGLDAGAEISSFNCGPVAAQVAFKRPEGRIKLDGISAMTFGMAEEKARIMLQRGIKPEFELSHQGQINMVYHLIDQGLAKPPYWFQFVLGTKGGSTPTLQSMLSFVDLLPADSLWGVVGIAQYQLPLNLFCILLGGHVRVGMEDSIYYRRGELATSNSQFVERIVRLAGEIGRPIASPAQTREMLGISPTPSRYEGVVR